MKIEMMYQFSLSITFLITGNNSGMKELLSYNDSSDINWQNYFVHLLENIYRKHYKVHSFDPVILLRQTISINHPKCGKQL